MGTVYNPNIPQPTNLISNSQDDILTNFTTLNTQFAVDHTAFNTGSGNGDGYHKQVTFPAVTSQGSQAGNSSVVYTKLVSSIPQLFYKNSAGDQQVTNANPIKAQILIDGATGLALGTPLNATSASGGTGTYIVTFSPAIGSTTYFYSLSTEASSSNNVYAQVANGTRASGGLTIQCISTTSVNQLRNAGTISLTVWV